MIEMPNKSLFALTLVKLKIAHTYEKLILMAYRIGGNLCTFDYHGFQTCTKPIRVHSRSVGVATVLSTFFIGVHQH